MSHLQRLSSHVSLTLLAFISLIAAILIVLSARLVAAGEPVAGDVITKANMDAYESRLAPSTINMLGYGMKIRVRAPESCPWPEDFKRATEKYSAQVKLGDDKRHLEGYVAGMPFPTIDPNDPDAAWKVMWNHEHKPAFSDDVRTEWVVENQNETGAVEKMLSSEVWRRLKWEGRIIQDPKPIIPHDPPLRYTEQWGPIRTPFDLVGTAFLLYRYDLQSRSDDSWLYLPQLRRVRRYSTSDRSGTLFGSDIDQDSIWGFNSKPEWWDFRLLGEKEVLVPMHAQKYGTNDVWCGDKGTESWVPCVDWEMRKVWLVEGRPTLLPVYAFAKRHLYIDQEVYNVSTSEMFDKNDELWKVWQNVFWCTDAPRAGRSFKDKRLVTPAVAVIDFQLMHSSRITPPGPATPLQWDWLFESGEASLNTPEFYTIASIIAEAR
jgi:hypothetical protein